MDRVVGELQRRALELRTTPLLRILEPLPRAARERRARARQARRGASCAAPSSSSTARSSTGSATRSCTCVRNAVDHGIESPDERARGGQARRSGASRSTRAARRTRSASRSRDDGARHRPRRGARARRRGGRRCIRTSPPTSRPRRSPRSSSEPGLSTARSGVRDLGARRRHGRREATLESLGGRVELAIAARARHDDDAASCRSPPRCSACCWSGSARRSSAIPIAKVERIVECRPRAIERAGARGASRSSTTSRCRCSTSPRGSAAAERSRPAAITPLVLTEVRGERVALLGRARRRAAADLREAAAGAARGGARARGPHGPRRRAPDLPARPEPDRMTEARPPRSTRPSSIGCASSPTSARAGRRARSRGSSGRTMPHARAAVRCCVRGARERVRAQPRGERRSTRRLLRRRGRARRRGRDPLPARDARRASCGAARCGDAAPRDARRRPRSRSSATSSPRRPSRRSPTRSGARSCPRVPELVMRGRARPRSGAHVAARCAGRRRSTSRARSSTARASSAALLVLRARPQLEQRRAARRSPARPSG